MYFFPVFALTTVLKENLIIFCFKALAQKGDMEERMMTLEKRYVRSQNELSTSNEEVEKLRAEAMGLQTMLEQV